MSLRAFTQELLTINGTRPLMKVAMKIPGQEHMLSRAAGWGALGGAGMYTGQKALAAAGAAEDPAFMGRTLVSDTAKASAGALMAAVILKALAKRV